MLRQTHDSYNIVIVKWVWGMDLVRRAANALKHKTFFLILGAIIRLVPLIYGPFNL
jgi:hypothetical protein